MVPKRGSIKGPVTVMTVLEVCEYLRVSRQTLYRMLRRGDIPAFRIGADWRFNIEGNRPLAIAARESGQISRLFVWRESIIRNTRGETMTEYALILAAHRGRGLRQLPRAQSAIVVREASKSRA